MSEEFKPMPQHPKRKFSGEYVGIVETGTHDDYMRVQVRVKEIFTDDVPAGDLPWATYRMPVGSRKNDGFFTPAAAGDYVWVDFPFGGDSRRPRITGSVHYCPDGIPNFPDEAFGGQDKCKPRRTGLEDEVKDEDREDYACVYKQHGVCVEVLMPEEKGKSGAVRVTNIAAGTNIEIDAAGNVIIHAVESLFLSTKKNQENAIHGDSDITVLGDINQSVMGNVTETTKGTHNISGTAGINITSDATITIKAPMVEIN